MVNGADVDIRSVRGPSSDSGVAGGDALAAFTDAVLSGSDGDLADTRTALGRELGAAAVVDTASVITMFTVMNRVADSTGTPVDSGPAEEIVRGIGEQLGMTAQA